MLQPSITSTALPCWLRSVQRERTGLANAFTLACGTLIGVDALYLKTALPDTWRAASPVRLLPIALEALRGFLERRGWFDSVCRQLEGCAFLRNTWLFGDRLPPQRPAQLMQAARPVTLAAGAALPGTQGSLHLVGSGGLVLKDGKDRLLETVKPGGFVGEEACLSRPAAPWQIRAIAPTTLLAFDCESLQGLPVVTWKLLETHERRLRSLELNPRG